MLMRSYNNSRRYVLPLEAALRLIGGRTDFKMYYSLYINYHCIYL